MKTHQMRRSSTMSGNAWCCFGVFAAVASGVALAASPPGWWQSWHIHQGQLYYLKSSDDSRVDDYMAANVGQLKNFATAAASCMKDVLSNHGYEGLEIAAMIDEWKTPATSTDDYAILTAGQAKAVAIKFYDRLASIYAWPANSQPWPALPTAVTDDSAAINLGQLKSIFSFDILNPDEDFDDDDIPNGFEIRYGLDFRVADADEDADDDGLSNLHEYWLGLNPLLADSDGNGIDDGDEDTDLDGVSNRNEILAGTDPADSLNGVSADLVNINDQASPQLILQGKLAPEPVQLKIRRYNSETNQHDPVPGIPVLFEIQEGQGTLVNVNGQESATRLAAYSNEAGLVTMQFRGHSAKQTARVRASIVRPKPGLVYPAPQNFIFWTSQCEVDEDGDGMDDFWEAAIVSASQGTLSDITMVNPEDDFDGDGYPNIFEFERGTDPTDPLSYPMPDVVLDHAGANHGSAPVMQSWNKAVINFATAGGYAEHPETRVIVQVMPGTWNVDNHLITKSALIIGRGHNTLGLPILVPGTNYWRALLNVSLESSYRRGIFVARGLVLDGNGVDNIQGVNLSEYSNTNHKNIALFENCIIRRCRSSAFNATKFDGILSFSTIINCGKQAQGWLPGMPAIYLNSSNLTICASISWNPKATSEINIGNQSSSWISERSVIGLNPGINAGGRLVAGPHLINLFRMAAGASNPPLVDIDEERRSPFFYPGADYLRDSDGDGLDDENEIILGCSPWLADTDGDGVDDLNDPLPLDPSVSSSASLISVLGPPQMNLLSPQGAVLLQ